MINLDIFVPIIACISGGFLIGFVFGRYDRTLVRLAMTAEDLEQHRKADHQRHAMLSAAGKKGRAKQLANIPNPYQQRLISAERQRRRDLTDRMRASMGKPPIDWDAL